MSSKWGVDEGGDSDTTENDEVGNLAAELATTGGGSDSNLAANTMGKGKPS
jgi:hypothetical protein